ncbi:hypothetical protein GJ744_007183 [Endocarpon pusillum]|uniref:Nudix hydrolase domain-containing protein n=1 Tax=Endocarpon pusillum TaxID=364733 RepID=A0A8H7AMG0_9EURO|nr:hypothetical protein GJ744_007183 [Endocarpon pusillum]
MLFGSWRFRSWASGNRARQLINWIEHSYVLRFRNSHIESPTVRQRNPYGDGERKPARRAPARPSSSVILVSPDLEILLLHRVQTSSSFPSAHVFPGGHIDGSDGHIPENGIERYHDNRAYRVGALRELFEETGIVLARQDGTSPKLISMPQESREEGRKLVHSGKISFQAWLTQQSPNAVLDTDGLIPFSHWVTPRNIPRRFATQMYLHALSASEDSHPPASGLSTTPTATADFTPTPDNNLENTSTTFHPAHHWLHLAQSGKIILFPPQFLLLHLISRFLDDNALPAAQRVQRLKDFIYHAPADGSPPWAEKCISPYVLRTHDPHQDDKAVLALDKSGPEMEELGSGSRGDWERVVLFKWSKEGFRELEVRGRREVQEEGRVNGKGRGNGNEQENRSERAVKL